MSKSMLEHIIGDVQGKQEYRQFMKRVNTLPEDYRFAFKKIQHYMDTVCGMVGDGSNVQQASATLLELFESSAAQSKPVLAVTGSDVAAFCDGLMRATSADHDAVHEKLNHEIQTHFFGEGK